MKNLLSHLIHLTVITEFEILFYIYYILPYEKQLVYDMFSKNKLFDSLNSFDYDETHKIRKSNISFIEDDSFNWVYDKLVTAVKYVNETNYNKVLYGIEPLQYTEYDSSYQGFYGIHKDENESEVNIGLLRKLSFTMQLSDPKDYTGGDLVIHSNDRINGTKKLGDITFFDSMTPHEVLPVESGFRKSLVGWVVGPRI